MSYDLKPKNKEINELRIGAFSWPMYLQITGAGYIVGYGESRSPAEYTYQRRKNASPVSNDGFPVTATEAKAMAMVVRGFVAVRRFINKQWDELDLSDEEKEQQQKLTLSDGKPLYQGTWHEDRLKELEVFALFAEQSKGFTIH
jgi:hypothetical protein